LVDSITQRDAAGNQLGSTVFGYDAHGRQTTVTDARNGTTTQAFDDADRIVATTSPAPGNGQPAQTRSLFYDSRGRVWRVVEPDGTSRTNVFLPTGNLQLTAGSRTLPVGYGYDDQGRVISMTNWSAYPSTGARVTQWAYDGYRGFLTNKSYEGGTAVGYSNTAAGKLKERAWARGVKATWFYSAAGDPTGIGYSDGTPAWTNTVGRGGRVLTAGNGTNTMSFIYNDASQVLSEAYSGGVLNGLNVTNTYDTLLRRSTVSPRNGSTVLATHTYGYQATSGRLETVSDGTQSAAYAYLANSRLVSQITFK
jgi:YD repeat-containing protein